jgi:hypothetical protein
MRYPPMLIVGFEKSDARNRQAKFKVIGAGLWSSRSMRIDTRPNLFCLMRERKGITRYLFASDRVYWPKLPDILEKESMSRNRELSVVASEWSLLSAIP